MITNVTIIIATIGVTLLLPWVSVGICSSVIAVIDDAKRHFNKGKGGGGDMEWQAESILKMAAFVDLKSVEFQLHFLWSFYYSDNSKWTYCTLTSVDKDS